ncbi:DUF2897 family protein [Vreelandella utahensis]|uniref:DUF2897 family protein n=1 Tax=Vreelandella halophila TaxID=86177 RepID=UPI0009850B75|nr:DUF2897 family protein [Halomonas utahensis]
MTATEWIILIVVLGSMLGGVFMLKNRAHKLDVSGEKMERIRKRKAELEEQERRENEETEKEQ